MVRSMTGFGREFRILNGKEITVEIRSVNHRFHEFSAKTPYQYRYVEERLKNFIGERVSRGKVDVSLIIHNISGKETRVILNSDVVESYLKALHALRIDQPRIDLALIDNFSIADVFRIPDAFTVIKHEIDEEEAWSAIKEVTGAALDKFIKMRETEGAKMKADILERLVMIEKTASDIEAVSPEITANHRERLLEKMKEVISSEVDEKRVLLEAAIFAEKTAVDEETVRLKSHAAQARDLLNNEDVIGRKLDFIVQEMNREINTIGSKVPEIGVTRLVVELKSELEKIREQIQNIE
ncbi:MAG: YicC family protein [Oscillospiraceae bacterium]|nr:YicC family protein [Oscillospiraceae bacterium]